MVEGGREGVEGKSIIRRLLYRPGVDTNSHMNVLPGVYSYEVEWEYDEPLGVHVIETDHATVLFGAGTADTGDVVAEIASNHDVDVVIAEHGDNDHYGGIPAIRDAVPAVDVAVPAGDAHFLEEVGIDVDTTLESDTSYWGIRTISTPGHTPDNMTYLHGDVLVVGDTVVGVDSPFAAAEDWTGPLAVIDTAYNDDDRQTRASVSLLTEHEFDVILLSHGPNVTENGREMIDTLIADLR